MSDMREQIMARLLLVLNGVEGINGIARNVKTVSEDKLPALILLEGDEEADENDPVQRRGAGMDPRRIHMIPQIVLAHGNVPEEVGEDINTLRSRTILAIVSDATLRQLTHNGAGVRYLGFESDLALGRTMMGQMALRFRLTYAFKPAE